MAVEITAGRPSFSDYVNILISEWRIWLGGTKLSAGLSLTK